MVQREPSAAFVSYRAAKPDGDGGNHRAYQILLDLQAQFDPSNVWKLTIEDWLRDPRFQLTRDRNAPSGFKHIARRLCRRISRMTENPYKLLSREGWSHSMSFGTRGVLSQEFVTAYVDRIQTSGPPDICVVDHPVLDQIRVINSQYHVSTVIASHNIESLDVARLNLQDTVAAHAASVDLANELRALSRYQDRFAISKVEAAFITGVGLSCEYYPYLPVGEVRRRSCRIAQARARAPIEPNSFLLMGTASHAPTRRSLEWFFQHVAQVGLPPGARVMVVGSKVDQLSADHRHSPGLELHGRVSDADLQDLLCRVGAALVPQRMGFGAVTRLAELACAGVPVLTFPHAAFAVDVPPGVEVLQDDSWSTLVKAMGDVIAAPRRIQWEEYLEWEKRTARPLGRRLRQFVLNSHV